MHLRKVLYLQLNGYIILLEIYSDTDTLAANKKDSPYEMKVIFTKP